MIVKRTDLMWSSTLEELKRKRDCLEEILDIMVVRGIVPMKEGTRYAYIFDYGEKNPELCTCIETNVRKQNELENIPTR